MKEHIVENKTLICEWDWEKNQSLGLNPTVLTVGSGKKAWWKCKNNHSWFARIDHRSDGAGCPYCSGSLPIDGINDLVSTCKQTLDYWDFDKNIGIRPNDFLPNSERRVYWKCSKGHSWKTAIANFTKNPSCPYCSGKKLLYGLNDLETIYPDIAKEWNYEKNKDKPRDYFKSSNKVVWWKCSKGHEWKERISGRTTQGLNCPYCSHKRASDEYNLLKINPILCSEWDYEKNGDLKPSNYLPFSNEKVWWKCKYGHHWKTTINNRANGNGCPICKKNLQTSFPEQAIFYYFKNVFIDTVNEDKSFGVELDVYIPSKRIALEYDGVAFHKNERKRNIDIKKNELCIKNNIQMIRILEKGLEPFDNCKCFTREDTTSDKSLENVLKAIFNYLDLDNSRIDIDADRSNILSLYLSSKEENSLASVCPDLLKEWDYEKNGNLQPNMFTKSSSQIVWWKCSKCGYSWKSHIYSRTSGHGCIKCGRELTIKGKQKRVICIETNEVFNSIIDAEQKTKANKNSIIRCCKGKGQTAGGYHWKYVD